MAQDQGYNEVQILPILMYVNKYIFPIKYNLTLNVTFILQNVEVTLSNVPNIYCTIMNNGCGINIVNRIFLSLKLIVFAPWYNYTFCNRQKRFQVI